MTRMCNKLSETPDNTTETHQSKWTSVDFEATDMADVVFNRLRLDLSYSGGQEKGPEHEL